jgi:hypothetical protein
MCTINNHHAKLRQMWSAGIIKIIKTVTIFIFIIFSVTLETVMAMASKFRPAGVALLIKTYSIYFTSNFFTQRPINIFFEFRLKSYYICISILCARLKCFKSLKTWLEVKQRAEFNT